MTKLESFIRQPTTLIAIGCVVGAVVYWFTDSPAITLASIAAVLGPVDDNTAKLLPKIEALEDAVRAPKVAS